MFNSFKFNSFRYSNRIFYKKEDKCKHYLRNIFRKECMCMKEKEHPVIEITTRPGNVYDDDNIPEIDLPRPSNVTTNVTPDEVPRRDGPGGE